MGIGRPYAHRQIRRGIGSLKSLSDEANVNGKRDVITGRLPSVATTPVFKLIYDAIVAVQTGKKPAGDDKDRKTAEIAAVFKAREPVYEREMIKFFLKMLDELPAAQKFAGAESVFGTFEGKARRSAEEAFAVSIAEGDLDTPEKVAALYDMSAADLQGKYPNIYKLSLALAEEKGALGGAYR